MRFNDKGRRIIAEGWTKEFYEKQEKWTKAYCSPIMQYHHEKVGFIEGILDKETLNILELGAGGGQFAVASALRGHNVTAVEINPQFLEHALEHIKSNGLTNIILINDSFYDAVIDDKFDAVCYWDGFGIGEDEEQARLLKRISCWLSDEGTAFIDIYTPWYWSAISGNKIKLTAVERVYDFDHYNCRMLDTLCPEGHSEDSVTQSLRCYSPADLKLLLKDSGLVLMDIVPGGSMDYDTNIYTEKAPLGKAMSYTCLLEKSPILDKI